jgi:hypothetical protein
VVAEDGLARAGVAADGVHAPRTEAAETHLVETVYPRRETVVADCHVAGGRRQEFKRVSTVPPTE